MSKSRLAQVVSLIVFLALVGCGGEAVGSRNDSSPSVSQLASAPLDTAPVLAKVSLDEGPAARGATSTTADVAGVCLTPQEAELARLINEYRATKGLPAAQISKSLTLVAQQHAWDSVNNSNAWPAPPEGQRCNMHSWSGKVNPVLTEGTWTAVCYTPDHANMAATHRKPREIAGYQGDGYENSHWASAGATAAGALNGWQNSPGHNALITEQNGWGPNLALGVGINGQYAHMWMGEVIDPAGSPPLCAGGTVAEPTAVPAATEPANTEAPTEAAPTAVPPTEVPPTAVPPVGAVVTGEIMNQTGTIADGGIAHTFDVAAGQRYRVVVAPSANFDVAADYTCTTGNSSQSASIDSEWEGGAESFAINAPGNGTCTVSVSGYNGSTGDYTIVVTTE